MSGVAAAAGRSTRIVAGGRSAVKVKCHWCGKEFQHYGIWSRFLWCSSKCHDADHKHYKQARRTKVNAGDANAPDK
jgi:endogenous inhibitor of DNA gyrase (YacG/DUF329 family)